MSLGYLRSKRTKKLQESTWKFYNKKLLIAEGGWVEQGECGEYEGETMLNILYIPETKKVNKNLKSKLALHFSSQAFYVKSLIQTIILASRDMRG